MKKDGMSKKNLWQKTIALLCVIVMVFYFLPMNVFALSIRENIEAQNNLGTNEETISQNMEAIDVSKEFKNKKILKEDVNARKSNEKHYILEDGTNVAAIFSSNIHYKEDGKYVDVDNTLEEKKDTKETFKLPEETLKKESNLTANNNILKNAKDTIMQAVEDNVETKVYENKQNSFKTKFSNKTKNFQIGSLTSEGNTITWRLKNSDYARVSINNPKENTKIIPNETTVNDISVNQISSNIKYDEILPNVDISYVLAPEHIKENIVLNNKESINNKLVFEYETDGLKMKLQDNNDIIVFDKDEKDIKFTIKAPFMYDGKLEFTDKIDVKLEQEDEKYIITIDPDKEWLNDEERVFPVVIDPTIQTSLYVQNINDTFIYKGDTNNTTRHEAHILRVGNGSGNGKSTRSLIKFSLPALKSGDQIIAAELNICNYPDTDEWTPPTDERVLAVHKMTGSWTASKANWSNTSTIYDKNVADFVKYKYSKSESIKDYKFDITNIVKDWYTNGKNYGVMIKEYKEKSINTGSDAYFFSADVNVDYTNCRPQILMAYRNQTGIEDYLSYHTQSIGRAGDVYTNDYNGNLTLIHEDAKTPGDRLPVTIRHVYNTNEKDTDIGYGKGFRLNLSQTLEATKIGGNEYLKYIDEDATAHYLLKDTSTQVYKDEDGLGLTAEKSGNNVVMKDKSGNKITFAKYASGNKWHLKEIVDTNKNKITLTLTTSGSKYLISKVTDGAGDSISISYSSGKLNKITDKASKTLTYTYNTTGNLSNITYSDGKKASYTYGSKNELKSVKNIDGGYINYAYYPGSVYRVKSITEYGTNGTKGNSLTITYGDNLTKFVDNKGYANNYTFDNYGHCITIADFGKDKENIDKAYGKKYLYGTEGNTNNKLTLESKLVSVKEIGNNLIKNPNFDSGETSWVRNNLATADKVVSSDGNKMIKITGDPNTPKNFRQTVKVTGKKGDIFTLYGWAKSLGIPNEVEEKDVSSRHKSARISIHIFKTDGSVQYENAMIVNGTEGWQFISKQIVANGDYNEIRVYLMFNRNANTIYYDNIGLFKEEFGESYQYDKNGNISSSQDLAKENSTFKFSGNNNLLENINPKGGSFRYEYDYNNKNRLLNASDTQGRDYSFEYDNYGNTKSIKTKEGKKSDLIEDGKTYFIQSAYSNKYFDIKDESTKDDATLQQWSLDLDNLNQQYTLNKVDEEYFKIVPNHVKDKALCYDASNGNNVIQKNYKDEDKFKWKVIENNDGSYRLENKEKPDYVISLKNNSTSNSVTFILEKWNGKLSQSVYLYNNSKKDEIADRDILESGEVYYIKSKNSNLYLEIESGDEYAMLQQKEFKENDKKQLWRIVREYDNVYKIISLGTTNGKALYPKGEVNQQEQLVGVKTYKNSTPQKWAITKNENGTYSIATMMEGDTRYLRAKGNSKNSGVRIVMNTSGDQYYLEKANMVVDIDNNDTYTIKNKNSNLYISYNGNSISQQKKNTENIQNWILQKEDRGYYSIRNENDKNKVLSVKSDNTIQLISSTGADTEKFEIVPTGNGTYTIRPKGNKGNNCLTIKDASKEEGASVINSSVTEKNEQYFYINKVKENGDDKYIETKASYNDNGNYMTKIEDQLGNNVTYEYDESNGLVKKVTDAEGNEITYEYDGLGNLINISADNGNNTHSNTYTYENDLLTGIQHNGTNYHISYDEYGNQKNVKVEDANLITNTYESNNGNLIKSTYGNSQTVNYTYDRFDRITSKEYSNGKYTFSYDGRGNLKNIVDEINNNTTTYTYDLAERLTKEENTNGYQAEYEYDKNSNISKINDKLNNDSKITIYNYDLNNYLNSIDLYNGANIINHYDKLQRISQKEIKTNNGSYYINYEYIDIKDSNKTTTQIKSISNSKGDKINYTYDKNGNIKTISNDSNILQEYYYDNLNQLIREDNKEQNKTITYSYDEGGNLTTKKEYQYTNEDIKADPTKTINYTYSNENWNDQLTKYDGKVLTYDEIGNLLTYNDNTYTWQNGRELSGINNSRTGSTISYKYNSDGIRTYKNVNGVETYYYLRGDKVIYEKTNDNIIYYMYDENDELIGLTYNNSTYYYKKNLQGDIIGILDENLNDVVKYSYDSWGKVLNVLDANGNEITDSNHIGNINPYRYKGYRYDNETGLYYLQSRYYNPEFGRFINADALLSTGDTVLSHNMYMYCNNNPINMEDGSGEFALSAIFGGTAIAALAKAVAATVATFAGLAAADKVATEVKKSTKKEKKNNTVYRLRNKTTKKVEYVGRTVNITARKNYHKTTKPNHEFEVIATNLTRKEARGLEQIYIIEYSTKNYLNKINGISPKNKKLELYMEAGRTVAKALGNIVSDEALYWTGN